MKGAGTSTTQGGFYSSEFTTRRRGSRLGESARDRDVQNRKRDKGKAMGESLGNPLAVNAERSHQ